MQDNTDNIFFSVIIPSYNRTESLFDSINSVLKQKFSNYEIIIIDDGSKKNIKEDIRSFLNKVNDKRIHFISLPENQGGAVARNHGINASKGRYIAFLDSDDKWREDKLTIDHSCIMSNKKIDLVYSPVANFKNGIFFQQVPSKGINHGEKICEYIFSRIKYGHGMQTSTLVVRREKAIETLFTPNLRGHQDWDFLLRFDMLNPIIFFSPTCMTDRSIFDKSDHSHVGRGLNYEFSKEFLRKNSIYMTKKSVVYFRTRVLLRKSILEKKEMLRNILYPGNILDIIHITKSFFKAL